MNPALAQIATLWHSMGGPFLSATTSTCDHRVYHVVVVALISVITGLAVGIGFAVLGQAPFTAVASGAAVAGFVFTAGMAAVAYVKRQA